MLSQFTGVERVFVFESGALAERIVRRGRRLNGDRIEIADGVRSGDQVVLDPSDRVTAGQKAEIARP